MNDQKKERFLITGGSGFVGWNLCNYLKGRHEVFATYYSHPVNSAGCNFLQIDLTSRSRVLETIARVKPSIILHAAALSSPDLCEKDRSRAREVNVMGTQHILDAACACGIRVVYISTDLVFDGETGNYDETCKPRPINYYGETKREGEKLCRNSPADSLVVRITLQYGWGNGENVSFSDWLMASLTAGKQVSLFADQYRTLTYVMDTARGLELAALQGSAGNLYHLTGPERIDRYEFGSIFASIFNFPLDLLKKSLMQDVPARAPRPKDVSLNGDRFFSQFGFRPRGIREGLAAMAKSVQGPSGQGFKGSSE